LVSLATCLTACRGFFGQAPIAVLVATPTTDQEVPVQVTFTISGSTDPDGTITSYVLDFGDRHTPQTGTNVALAIPPHTYVEAGTFTAVLTVTDNDGRIGKDHQTIVIGPAMLTFASDRGTSASYDLWRMNADGTDPQILLNTPNDELFPDLLRGTRDKVAYTAAEGGPPATWNVWTMTVDGLHAVQLTTQTQSRQVEPSWSRNGMTLAYASNAAQTPSTTTWEIYTMTAAGGSQTKLTLQSPSWAIAPVYSPVNNDILFVSNKGASGGGSAIWLWDDSAAGPDKAMELYDSVGEDGAVSPVGFPGVAPSLDLPSGISRPAWSPDGTSILFAMNQAGNIDLFTVAPPDGRVQRVTQHPDTDTEPEWSPDGQRIAFVSDRTGLPQVYLAQRSGGQLRRLTWEPDAYEGSPAWSPDGQRIAFVRRGFDGFDVYVSDLSGGTPLRLTEGDSNENPVWSPDGLQLAFCRSRGNYSDIWIMAADGSQMRQLTTDGTSLLPAWSPLPRENR